MCQFSGKTNNFDFFGSNLPKNEFWGRSWVELGEGGWSWVEVGARFSNTHFGSNNVEGVGESWVEAEMSWVEVDGPGWRWVHGFVIPILQYPISREVKATRQCNLVS